MEREKREAAVGVAVIKCGKQSNKQNVGTVTSRTQKKTFITANKFVCLAGEGGREWERECEITIP